MHACSELSWTTFVLSRRIPAPLADVEPAMTGTTFVPGVPLALGRDGELRLEHRFYFQWFPRLPAWRTTGELRDARGRRVARVELEAGAWSDTATELVMRPVARAPQRWGKRRLRRYFTLAHHAIDEIANGLDARRRLGGDSARAPSWARAEARR